MRVILLGTGTAWPVRGQACAGIYVEAAGRHLLFDAGPGTLQRLLAIGVTHRDLDRMFLTHFHPDHCAELIPLLFAMRLPNPARTKPLTITGPSGLRRVFRQLNAAFSGWLAPRGYRLTWREVGDASQRIGGCTVRSMKVPHGPPALGFRVEYAGKVVVYSGDTSEGPRVAELGRGADLLILECSAPDAHPVSGHLTPSACGRIAAAAGCRRLVLTHRAPSVREAQARRGVRRFYRGPLTFARDLHAFQLP
ncbi:MAG: MBL fold metallo-hydrolase [Candidatus Omnitrophica bacterium]|nr:MBL fold metallo-hydrolase [Candidatus Omnitrophota bacterium]